MTNLMKSGFLAHDEVGSFELFRRKFLSDYSGESLTFTREYTLTEGLLEVADAVATCFPKGDSTIHSPFQNQFFVEVPGKALVIVYNAERHSVEGYSTVPEGEEDTVENFLTPAKRARKISVVVTGDRSVIKAVFAKLGTFTNLKQAQIKWWYKGDHGESATRDVFLPPLNTELLPEFYPYLELDGERADPKKYLKKYLESDASILLMEGPPGTGKTTLLRHLICDFHLGAHVVYDEDLMKGDQVFQSFLFEKHSDVLIIEDADTILSDRDRDGNKLMARFLNVSDGLIKLPNKKVVFTTNINDFGRVDQALIRPGRCFDVAHTRALNRDEARAVAKVAGLPVPVNQQKHEFTLAELFNSKSGVTLRKIGFQ